MIKVKKFRLVLKIILVSFLAPLVIYHPVSVALSEELLDYYNTIGVYYYNPDSTNTDCVVNTDGSGITIIGDSITAGSITMNTLKTLLPNADIYAETSKHFGYLDDESRDPNGSGNPSGISIIKYLLNEGKLGQTVVFLLGTNDGLQESQFDALLDLLGTNRKVFLMTYIDVNGGHSHFAENNRLVYQAAENANVSVIPWAEEVGKDESTKTKYVTDAEYGVHPNEVGAKFFAELVDKAVGGSTSTTAGSNGNYTNYAGDQVLTEKELEQLERNIPYYQQALDETGAEQEYGINWQMLAAIQKAETGLGWANANSDGIYQILGLNVDPSATITPEEYVRQTKLAIGVLISKINALNLDLSQDEHIKKLFFSYNGLAPQYINRAIKMGFSQEEADSGEGSPYVMNRYDARRDPYNKEAVDSLWLGIFVNVYDNAGNVVGSKYDSSLAYYPFGTYTVYTALGGANYCKDETITSGGLTLSQAKIFMNDYIKNVECSEWDLYCDHGSVYGPKANCVTFVQYFISRFTSAGTLNPIGDGGWVVSNLTGTDVESSIGVYNHTLDYSAKGFQYGGNTPRPFAIFSTGSGLCGDVICGHTGVVLGIDEATDTILIGQAGYNTPLEGYSDVVEFQLSDYTNGNYWYAYTDTIINTDTIKQILGNS